MNNSKEMVLVTGASGWIAQFCIVELIRNGFYVRGSLRHMARQQEVIDAVSREVDPTNMLEFCKLDLLKDGGWDDAMNGCKYVLHLASPFVMEDPKDENELIEPAREGTLRAMKAAKKAGVTRIVVTSSIAAILAHVREGTVDANLWTDLKDPSVNVYQKSKTLAEKAAWDFIDTQDKKDALELSVINPGGVMGPTLGTDIKGVSLDICSQLLTGKMSGIPNLHICMIDVRDVAMLHVKAMTLPQAKNRRFISAHSKPTPFLEMAQTLKDSGYNVTTKKVPSLMLKIVGLFNSEAKSMVPFIDRYVNCDISETEKVFNWKPIPLKKSFLDMAKSVKAVLDSQ
tara:strand:+ start:69 stop:1094 length:1026 start_codon:yes stop_codon:yes gene_type:complete